MGGNRFAGTETTIRGYHQRVFGFHAVRTFSVFAQSIDVDGPAGGGDEWGEYRVKLALNRSSAMQLIITRPHALWRIVPTLSCAHADPRERCVGRLGDPP
jgi:hypothetical protein